MIAGATRGSGGAALARHLLKQQDGQVVGVMHARGLAADEVALATAGRHLLDWHERRLAKTEPKTQRHLQQLLDTEPFWHS